MKPLKCTKLIVDWKDKHAEYEYIDTNHISELLKQGNINGIFVIGTIGEDFVIILKLEQIPEDMKLYIKKNNGKLVDLKGLLSKSDFVLDENEKILFELNGTPVKYVTNEQKLVFGEISKEGVII